MAKVLLFCVDTVGQSMAGPAIRYWEMAKALSGQHDVTLLTLNKADIIPEGFKLVHTKETSIRDLIHASDVMIAQTLSPVLAWNAKRAGTRVILDAYDPMPLENLEIFRHQTPSIRNAKHHAICKQFAFDFKLADAVICANQRQRDLWMGLLLALGKITTQVYDKMPSLDNLLGVVPFGLSSTSPAKTGPGLRERFGIPLQDKVILWGGGIWNWFDPLTLLHAMHLINKERTDIHLVFMGIKHPNESIPEMEMCRETIALAKKLDLLDKTVHINYGWVPYVERQNFLLEADIGVSTHFDNLETQYSFRTRMLDYLWAGLPIIATQGDCFADLIHAKGLGLTVPYRDSAKLASAITTLCDQPSLIQDIKKNIEAIRPQFEWQHVTKPIHTIIQGLTKQEPQPTWKLTAQFGSEIWRTYGPIRLIQHAFKRLKRLTTQALKLS